MPGLFHLVQCPPDSFMFSTMIGLPSFLNGWIVLHCIYTYTKISLPCWWTLKWIPKLGNNASMSMQVQIFLWITDFNFFGYISSSENVGLHGRFSSFHFLRNFHHGYLHSLQQCIRLPVSPHLWCLLFSGSFSYLFVCFVLKQGLDI
jgi:hypothetical protein